MLKKLLKDSIGLRENRYEYCFLLVHLSKSTTFQLFKPERFLQEDMVERNPYSFLPFSAGSR